MTHLLAPRDLPADLALLSRARDDHPTQPETQEATVAEVIVRYLKQEGITTIFGVPGGPIMPLCEAIEADGALRFVLAKREDGAGFAADGFARLSGRPGAFLATTGPGTTNALTALATARRDSVPLLMFGGMVAVSAFGRSAAQECSPFQADPVAMLGPVTKAALMLPGPEHLPRIMRHLLRTACSGRPGPVFLGLPADMLKKRIRAEVWPVGSYRAATLAADRKAIAEAARLLARARCPALLAGLGVARSGAFGELRALAEQLQAAVATTPAGKGAFPEQHPLSVGVFGLAGSPQADAALLDPSTDVLLAIGSSLGENSTHTWDPRLGQGRSLIQLDVDPIQIGRDYPVTVALAGDARVVLTELIERVERELASSGWPVELAARRAALADLKAVCPRVARIDPVAPAVPLQPTMVVEELRRALPASAVVISGIGNSMAWLLHHFEVREPGSFILNLGLGAMGHALPAAIGAAAAGPGRVVCAVVGDAEFAMSGFEIHTAVEYDLPLLVVVLNNSGHGMVRLAERSTYGDRFNVSTFRRRLDVTSIASAGLGALALRAERPGQVEEFVRQGLNAARPTVIEVLIDPEAVPPLQDRLRAVDLFIHG